MSKISKLQPCDLSIRDVAERFVFAQKQYRAVSRWIETEGLKVHHFGRMIRFAEEDLILFMAMRRS